MPHHPLGRVRAALVHSNHRMCDCSTVQVAGPLRKQEHARVGQGAPATIKIG